MASHNELGTEGEKMAVAFLQNKGYSILETNYRYQKAEIDIIAESENTVVVVEVKTRSTPEFGNPHEFVKPKQIQSLVKAIDHYINTNDLDMEVRFDIVSIIKNKAGTNIEHLEDAFYHF